MLQEFFRRIRTRRELTEEETSQKSIEILLFWLEEYQVRDKLQTLLTNEEIPLISHFLKDYALRDLFYSQSNEVSPQTYENLLETYKKVREGFIRERLRPLLSPEEDLPPSVIEWQRLLHQMAQQTHAVITRPQGYDYPSDKRLAINSLCEDLVPQIKAARTRIAENGFSFLP